MQNYGINQHKCYFDISEWHLDVITAIRWSLNKNIWECFEFSFSRDHPFDKWERNKKREVKKRKRGEIADIDQPPKGCRPVWWYHSKDEKFESHIDII